MSDPHQSMTSEVEHLMRNAQLREELEPFLDDSIERINLRSLPTPRENEYLASMLAWERAPVLPIAEWFTPPLEMPHLSMLNDDQVHTKLWEVIRRLHAKRILLDFTDHLTDRQLYCMISRDILPSPEKKIESSRHYLHWDCADIGGDPDVWLRYYANDEERKMWSEHNEDYPPPHEAPPYPRRLPHHPL